MVNRRRNEFKNEQRKIQLLKQHIVMLQEHSAMVIESTTRPPPEELQILNDAGSGVIEQQSSTSSSKGDAQRGAEEDNSSAETGNGIPRLHETDDAINTQLSALRPFLPYALREVVEPPPKRLFPLVLKSHTNAPVVSGAEANDNTRGGNIHVSAAAISEKAGTSLKNNIFQVSKSSAMDVLDVQRVSLEIKVRSYRFGCDSSLKVLTLTFRNSCLLVIVAQAAKRAKELGRDSVVDLDDFALLQPTRKARTDASKRKFEEGSWTDAMKAAQLE